MPNMRNQGLKRSELVSSEGLNVCFNLIFLYHFYICVVVIYILVLYCCSLYRSVFVLSFTVVVSMCLSLYIFCFPCIMKYCSK